MDVGDDGSFFLRASAEERTNSVFLRADYSEKRERTINGECFT